MACLLKNICHNKKFRRFVVCQAYQLLERNIFKNASYFLSSRYHNTNAKSSLYMLGIETSGHNTGAAVVNEQGQILGEACYPQTGILVFGGDSFSDAAKHHETHIDIAVTEALKNSNVKPSDLSAVAVTVMPGDLSTLKVGCDYGKKFAIQNKLPLIPVNHLEAHALTIRMENEVTFPFVVVLVSGTHSSLCIAHSINSWSMIGDARRLSIGAALDEIAYRLNIRKLPDLNDVIGGKALEILAKEGKPIKFLFPPPKSDRLDPNYNFWGLKKFVDVFIEKLEFNRDIEEGNVLDDVRHICASVQYSLFKQLVQKTQLGLKFAEITNRILPENKTLVVSGGVASNQFLRDYFKVLCEEEGYKLLIPEPKLCTDNGAMIAWNGIEKWKAGVDILHTEEEIRGVSIKAKCPLGPNISKECRLTKIPKLDHCIMKYKLAGRCTAWRPSSLSPILSITTSVLERDVPEQKQNLRHQAKLLLPKEQGISLP